MASSIPKPVNPYFLVKLERNKEKEAKEKSGFLYIPPNEALMQYNLVAGEIVSISEKANVLFPEAIVGHQMLLHHFVQGMSIQESKDSGHLVHQDETYNYYVVTPIEHNGKGIEAYGVWDGEKIIPNKEYVFLETKQPVKDLPADEIINQALTQTESGLIVFKEWEDTRENKEARQANIKKEVEYLSKSGTNKSHIAQAIAEKEGEMGKISAEINKQKYLPHVIAFCNPELSKDLGVPVGTGDTLYMLNIATQTKIKFMDIEYIVAKTKYIGFLNH